MRSFMMLTGAILLAAGILASIHVYDVGWSDATYDGYDPWSLFFYGLGAAAWPATVALVWAGLHKMLSRLSHFPTVWLVVFTITTICFSAVSLLTARHDTALTRVRAEPALMQVQAEPAVPRTSTADPCPISADFVIEPEVIEASIPVGNAEVESLTLRSIVEGGVVSIECIGAPVETLYPNMTDRDILLNYARFWSVSPLENSDNGITQQSDPMPHLMLEGTKEIAGTIVRYSYRFFRFPTSFAMVATGVPEGTSNPPDVERFLNSLETAEDRDVESVPSEFSEEAKRAGLESHMASCVPTIQASNEASQLRMTERQISSFCSCTGGRYFEEFTQEEFSEVALGNNPALNERRSEIQTECLLEIIE
jgi:hypothetical protein